MTNVLPMRRPFRPTGDETLDGLTIQAMAAVLRMSDLDDDWALRQELMERGFSREAVDRYRDAAIGEIQRRRAKVPRRQGRRS